MAIQIHVTPWDWFWMAIILTCRQEDSKGLVLVNTEQWLLIWCCFQCILLSTKLHSSSAGSGGQLKICMDRHFHQNDEKKKKGFFYKLAFFLVAVEIILASLILEFSFSWRLLLSIILTTWWFRDTFWRSFPRLSQAVQTPSEKMGSHLYSIGIVRLSCRHTCVHTQTHTYRYT